MTALDWLFAAFAVLVALGALAAVVSKQVVHAALWLVVALGGLAGSYLALGAEVVALVQLLVYVGAVVVLVLFALMLTRAPIGRHDDLDAGRSQRVVAALAGLGVSGLLAGVLLAAFGDRRINPGAGAAGAGAADAGTAAGGQSAASQGAGETVGGAESLGQALFTAWVLPFELLSVLLLAALVGALAIARGRRQPAADGAPLPADPEPRATPEPVRGG